MSQHSNLDGPPAIDARSLVKTVQGPAGALTILDGTDLQVARQEAVAILGASGSGKSTLLGLLAGLDTPSDGRVRLLGEDLGHLDEDQRARLRAGRVGFVFQSFELLPGLTALENVMLPLEMAGRTRQARATARGALERVGLQARAEHMPTQLSGGEQQRVAIARAFVTEPEVLFADEPTGNLDQETGQQVVDLLFALREAGGTSLVLVTHDPRLAQGCQRRLYLDHGRLASP